MVIGVAFGLMSAFFMAGFYVAAALGGMALIMMYFFSDAPLWNAMSSRAWEANTSFILVAVPLFILMGELLIYSRISERMYQSLSHWLNPLPGGLIHSNIAFCGVFGAISGSSAAATATIGSVALPAFRRRGYNERLVMGSIAAGGTMDILIPPSIAMIIYAVLVEESVGRMYYAGFIPGAIMVGVFMLLIGVIAKIWPSVAPREALSSWRDRIIGLLSLMPFIVLAFIVLGTIYLGVATPTEAAAFGVTAALILAVVNNSGPAVRAALRGNLNRQQAKEALQVNLKIIEEAIIHTARTTGMLFLIVLAAFTLSFAFARLGISQQIANWVSGFDLSAVELVLILVVFYLILGTFMESFSMMVTTVPILVPVLQATGVDLVWFGIIMVILLEAALISPPEGLNLYVLHGIRQSVEAEQAAAEGVAVRRFTIADVWIGVLPFMIGIGIVIALLIAFPELALWLPDQMIEKR